MPKFIFGLDSILQIKEKIEDQEKINFGNAQAILNEAVRIYEELLERQADAEDNLRDMLNRSAPVLDIRQAESGVSIIKMYCRTQLLKVREEEKNVEEARIRLEEAMKERKTYEKLKENEFERYKQEMQKKEGLEIDELVSYKYSPNTISEVR